MMRAALLACLLALPLAGAAVAADKSPFSAPVALRGTLGDAEIQIKLRPKQEFEGGLEGEYFRFGGSGNVLLAGEFEDGEVFLEESENGTDVSGDWNGKLNGDLFSGEWMSADGSVRKPFSVRIVQSQKNQAKP